MTTRGRSNYALLLNKSGGTVLRGQVIIPDSTTDLAFTTSTTAADLRVFGVVVDVSILDNAIGLVQLFGSIVEVLLTTAAVTRGHYIKQGTTAGKVTDTATAADATTSPPTGAVGIALSAVGGAGEISAFIFPAQPASGDVPTQGNFNSTVLDFNAVVDGEFLKRSGTGIVSGVPSGTGTTWWDTRYQPDMPPASPSASDDEFDDGALAGAWTQFGTPDTVDETDRDGYLLIQDNDGASAGVYKAYVPGAAILTVATKVHGDVSGAASNQVLISLRDSGGTAIVSLGMLNGSAWIASAAAFGGGFTSGTLTYVSGNMGGIYFAIQRDATTNYTFHISPDGIIWHQVASCSQAGTIARLSIEVAGFSATNARAYYDFVRAFTTATLKIGNTP